MRKNQLKQKKAARRKSLRNRFRLVANALLAVAVIVVVSGFLIFVHDYLVQTVHFQARRVVVQGQERLDRQRVLDIAGIGSPVNILSVNLTAARRRLLADPWIADATVQRKIPSELRIRIREQKPLAVLALPDGQRFLLNVEGQVFKRPDAAETNSLPLVTGITAADLPVPDVPPTDSFKALMNLFRLAQTRKSPLPLQAIQHVRLDREIGITVYTKDAGRAIQLGFGHYEKKVKVLGMLMDRLRTIRRFSRLDRVDLFDLDRIVITPALTETKG